MVLCAITHTFIIEYIIRILLDLHFPFLGTSRLFMPIDTIQVIADKHSSEPEAAVAKYNLPKNALLSTLKGLLLDQMQKAATPVVLHDETNDLTTN